jgi:hypothetical protein
MRLRQIALVARDLDAARADISALLTQSYAYDDPGVGKYGLRNAVFPVGTTFLEVVSPKVEATTAGRLLEKRGGDGGYMVILQTTGLKEARQRVRDAGARIVDEITGDGFAFTHIHPRDVGGAILSIDWMDPPERWQWGGPEWREHPPRDPALAIVGAELQAEAPDKMALRWAEVLGRPAERDDELWKIALADGELRFAPPRDQRGEGLRAFDIAASDARAIRSAAQRKSLVDGKGDIVVCGTIMRLVDA